MAKVIEYAKKHNISTVQQWLKASESENFPESLPKRPPNVYGCKWSEILSKKSGTNGKFLSMNEASEIMQKMSVNTTHEFRELGRNGGRPSNIPANPERTYKNEWQGWHYFLTGEKKSL